MTSRNTQILHILYTIVCVDDRRAVDRELFGQLFSEWFDSVRAGSLLKSSMVQSEPAVGHDKSYLETVLPFYPVQAMLDRDDVDGAIKTFPDAVSEHLRLRAEQTARLDYKYINADIVSLLGDFEQAPEKMQPLYREASPTLLANARNHFLTVFAPNPLLRLLAMPDFLDVSDAKRVVHDCFAFVEIALDQMSLGRRESRRDIYLGTSEDTKAGFADVLACRDKQKLAKILPTILDALRKHFMDAPDIDTEHADFRMLCQLRIEHAIVWRQFSFKARPKHFNYTDAAQSMRDCRAVFDGAGVDIFLMSGTLLGAVREKGFIASDYDIDIGIFDTQATIADITRIITQDERFDIDEIVEDSIVKIKHSSGIVIDIFLYFEVDGLLCHRGAIHEWYNGPFGLTETDFLGGRYLIPDNHEDWLAENYGNWQKPGLFYDMSYDTPNRDYVRGSTVGIYYLWGRMEKSVRRGWTTLLILATNAMKREFDIDFTRHLLLSTRRPERIEPAINTLAADDIDRIFVAPFDALTTELATAVENLSDGGHKVLAVVLSDKHPDGGGKASTPDRLALANAMRGLLAVHMIDSPEELQQVIQAFPQAECVYLDDSSSETNLELVDAK